MKSHKLLYQLKNKLTWLPIIILAACQNNIIYHSYTPVPLDGWNKSDTLVYTLPNSIPAGNYEAEIGIRYQESYPYRDIWLEVSHNNYLRPRYSRNCWSLRERHYKTAV